MSDLGPVLERGVGDFDPSPEGALGPTLRRARGRRIRRQVAVGAVTLALSAGLLGGAWWAFRSESPLRPVVGPSSSASPEARFPPRITCYEHRWSVLPVCIARNGPIVTMAEMSGASRWTLLGFRATYTGTPPELQPGSTTAQPVARPMICVDWVPSEEIPEFVCETALRDGRGMFGTQLGVGLKTQIPPPGWADQVAEGDPFPDDPRGTTYVQNYQTDHVRWGWVSSTTVDIAVTPEALPERRIRALGPFPELGTEAKWFVAFSPIDVPTTTLRGYDRSGAVMWSRSEPEIVPVRVVMFGEGSGTVLGSPVQVPGRKPRINCGSTCSTEVLPGFELTLRAIPAERSRFDGWTGACSGTQATCELTVQRGTDVGAVFEPQGS